jgi:hypothetical protein
VLAVLPALAVPAVRWTCALVLAAAAGLSLGACSNSGSSTSGNFPTNVQPSGTPMQSGANVSGGELLRAALSDVTGATSFRLQAVSKVKNTTTKVDMRYGRTGSHGTITIDSSVLDLIRVGSNAYVKAPDSFWQTQLPAAQLASEIAAIHGKWVLVPALGTTFAQLSAYTDKQQITAQLVRRDTTHYLQGANKVVDNVESITLADTSNGAVVYVAATGRPYPVEATGGNGTSATAHFSEWNAPFSVAAPPAAQTYTLPAS